MKQIKMALYFVGLGAVLVAYAHGTFATKKDVEYLIKTVDKIDKRVYVMHRYYKLEER